MAGSLGLARTPLSLTAPTDPTATAVLPHDRARPWRGALSGIGGALLTAFILQVMFDLIRHGVDGGGAVSVLLGFAAVAMILLPIAVLSLQRALRLWSEKRP